MNSPPGQKASLWLLTASPGIWAAHFLLSYTTAAVWCAKFAGRDGSLGNARVAIAIYTAAALVGIGVTGWRGLRLFRMGKGVPLDSDTPEDQYRFLGFATVLLSLLSAIATLFAGAVVLFFKDCR